VGQGVSPATIPNVTVFQGPGVTSSTPETVSFILDERNVQQLEAQTDQGFNNFLSVNQFAQQYVEVAVPVENCTPEESTEKEVH